MTRTRFGDFNTANLEQFLKVKDSFRVDMASVRGTPLHYFLQNARGFASGESLKKNETRFLAKVRDRQESFGQTWADLMSFALNLAGYGRDIQLLTQWEDPAPMEEKEFLENILLKKQIGVSVEQALKEAGYGDVDVNRMIETYSLKDDGRYFLISKVFTAVSAKPSVVVSGSKDVAVNNSFRFPGALKIY